MRKPGLPSARHHRFRHKTRQMLAGENAFSAKDYQLATNLDRIVLPFFDAFGSRDDVLKALRGPSQRKFPLVSCCVLSKT
jgi:hypothetical protein